MVSDLNRIEIGFTGEQVITLKLEDGPLTELRKKLPDGGWLTVTSEEGEVDLDLDKVAFLRVTAGGHTVGFGS